MEFNAQSFRFKDTLDDMRKRLPCDFCDLRLTICRNLGLNPSEEIHFDRHDSMIRINERYPPIMTLRRGQSE